MFPMDGFVSLTKFYIPWTHFTDKGNVKKHLFIVVWIFHMHYIVMYLSFKEKHCNEIIICHLNNPRKDKRMQNPYILHFNSLKVGHGEA